MPKSLPLLLLAIVACKSGTPGAVAKAVPKGDIPIFATMARDEDLARADAWDVFARYDLLLVTKTPGTVAPLRLRNPKIVILAHVNPYFALGAPLWPDHAYEPESKEPTWVLRDAAGAPIKYHGPLYPGMDPARLPTLMDVRVLAWQEHFLRTVSDIVRAEGLDGVFLDTLTETYPEFARTRSGAACRDFDPVAWKGAAHEFLARTRKSFPAPLKIVFNGLSLAPGTGGDGDLGFLSECDGASYEAFGIAWPLEQDSATKRWYFTHAIQTAMVRARDAKKLFLLQVTGDEDDEQLRLYALCAFLLQKYEGAYFYMSRTEGEPRWYPEWGTRLSAGLSEAREENGLWRRDYEGGTVWLNPSSADVGGMRPFSGRIVPVVR